MRTIVYIQTLDNSYIWVTSPSEMLFIAVFAGLMPSNDKTVA